MHIKAQHDGSPLYGEVELSGSKHAFAHVLAVAAMSDNGRIMNIPDTIDSAVLIQTMESIFGRLTVDWRQRTLEFSAPREAEIVRFPAALLESSRSLYCLIPAALHHAGRLELEHVRPTGCHIGDRPGDWYVQTLAKFGVSTESCEDGTLSLSWRTRRAAEVSFGYPSMTASVVALAASTVAPGRTIIDNATLEPSFDEQASAAVSNGQQVDIHEGRSRYLEVLGKRQIKDFEWEISSDRIEAVTLLTAGLLSRGEVTVRSNRPLVIPNFLKFCDSIGADWNATPNATSVRFPRGGIMPTVLNVGSEPKFSSDWGPFVALLLATRAGGRSTITDDVFALRFQFMDLLQEAGLTNYTLAEITKDGRRAVELRIDGKSDAWLSNVSVVDCPDIRGSAAIILASIVADGAVELHDDWHLRRGYGSLGSQLKALGLKQFTEYEEGSK